MKRFILNRFGKVYLIGLVIISAFIILDCSNDNNHEVRRAQPGERASESDSTTTKDWD